MVEEGGGGRKRKMEREKAGETEEGREGGRWEGMETGREGERSGREEVGWGETEGDTWREEGRKLERDNRTTKRRQHPSSSTQDELFRHQHCLRERLAYGALCPS